MSFELQNGDENKPTVLFADNQGAMELAYNDVINEKTKHIDVNYNFIKEKVKDGTIVFNYVPTSENAADIMTKMLQKTLPAKMTSKLGMQSAKNFKSSPIRR